MEARKLNKNAPYGGPMSACIAPTKKITESLARIRESVGLGTCAFAACIVFAWPELGLAQTAQDAQVQETTPSENGASDLSGFGSGSVNAQLHDIQEARKKAPRAWPAFPSFDEIGLSLGGDYNILYQHVSDSPGDDSATGGVARFFGSWKPDPQSPGGGRLVFKVEHRHRLGSDSTPKALLPTAGAAGGSGVTFSDAGAVLTNLFWTQSFVNNRFGFIAGVVDVTDYLDVFGLMNPWTDFNNVAFSTNPTIPAPSQGLGAAVRWMFTPNDYVTAGIADANGDPHKPGDFFDSFFDDAEYFKHVEFGRIGSWDKRSSDNTHISFWQVDKREKAGVDDGWGVALSWSRQLANGWLPFARAGYADGGGGVVDRSISVGTGYALNERGDYVAFGASWGRPASDTTGGTNVDQYTLETYYRLQVLKHLQIVPSLQYIIDPAYNPSEDSLWLFGLRMRATF